MSQNLSNQAWPLCLNCGIFHRTFSKHVDYVKINNWTHPEYINCQIKNARHIAKRARLFLIVAHNNVQESLTGIKTHNNNCSI